jgi:hypothetical protein
MRKLISILLISFFVIACSKKESNLKQPNLEKTIADLNVEIDALKRADKIAELISDLDSVAYLQIGNTTFSTIKTPIGVIAVKIGDIKPFANGSKVQLIFGNPLKAKLHGVEFKIDYGELNEDKSIKQDSEKTKDVSLNKELKDGVWNKEEVILEGLSDKKLGYVRIHDLTISSMSLFN